MPTHGVWLSQFAVFVCFLVVWSAEGEGFVDIWWYLFHRKLNMLKVVWLSASGQWPLLVNLPSLVIKFLPSSHGANQRVSDLWPPRGFRFARLGGCWCLDIEGSRLQAESPGKSWKIPTDPWIGWQKTTSRWPKVRGRKWLCVPVLGPDYWAISKPCDLGVW